MCGIAGIFRTDGRLTRTDVEAVLSMIDAQVHRGPDDWGILYFYLPRASQRPICASAHQPYAV